MTERSVALRTVGPSLEQKPRIEGYTCATHAELIAPIKIPWNDARKKAETCMRAAGYRITADCSAPLKTYESCMQIADKLMRGPTGSQYRDADWNRICLDNEWDVRTQERLSPDCYQSGSWWRRWLGR